MKKSEIKSFSELPMHLNAEMVAKVLGISISGAYELMHRKGFPAVRIGKRVIVPKDLFKKWLDEEIAKRGDKNGF